MKKLLPLLLLSACSLETQTTKIQPTEKPNPRIRELSLASESDGRAPSQDLLPSCDRNCKLWLVENPEDLFFCNKSGEDWLQLREYVGPDETMYCNL